MSDAEAVVVQCLCRDPDFAQSALPYLTPELFDDNRNRVIFGLVQKYFSAYGALPPHAALTIDLGRSPLNEVDYKETSDTLADIFTGHPEFNREWLMKLAEEWGRKQSMTAALRSSLELIATPARHGEIADKVQKALAFSFDSRIGHDYLEESDDRFDYYRTQGNRIPLNIQKFQEATRGGFPRKTLNIIQAGTNVGKTFVMCSFAAGQYLAGYNVLYISNEISEFEIGRRIDAALLGIPIERLNKADITETYYKSRVAKLRASLPGRLVIKEYPSSMSSINHYAILLRELEQQKGFKPDIIYVDYIGACASATVKDAGSTYAYMGAIAKELRGLGVTHNVPIVSATQFNRTGYSDTSTDNDMTTVAESFAIQHHADAIYSLKTSKEQPGIFRVGHIKSRYMRPGQMPVWTVGVDYDLMRLVDLDAPEELLDTRDEFDAMYPPNGGFAMNGIMELVQ
jgi:replicative DNA helicase